METAFISITRGCDNTLYSLEKPIEWKRLGAIYMEDMSNT
ncbi:MAG: hypothetical protein RLZZ148_1446, partial [Cyanobacteriota bacterium]